MVLGMITGTVLGLLAGFNILNALLVGVVAAMMFHVWPMALGVTFEGWGVFNEGMRNILVKWMKGKREVYIAVDTSVLLGHPTVGISTTLMYPIAFLLAFLLDEPIAHLDAKLRHRMYAELKRVMRARGTTALYATPAQTEAMAMADRIVVNFKGKMQQVGTARDLYEQPANVDVAKFGGEQTMNVLPAQFTAEDGVLSVGLDGGRIPIAPSGQSALEASDLGQDILLGVRPPDVECSLAEIEGALAGEVYTTEHLGRTTLVTVSVGERLIEVVSDCLDEAAVGLPIWLSFEGGRLYVFDPATSELVAATRAETAR